MSPTRVLLAKITVPVGGYLFYCKFNISRRWAIRQKKEKVRKLDYWREQREDDRNISDDHNEPKFTEQTTSPSYLKDSTHRVENVQKMNEIQVNSIPLCRCGQILKLPKRWSIPRKRTTPWTNSELPGKIHPPSAQDDQVALGSGPRRLRGICFPRDQQPPRHRHGSDSDDTQKTGHADTATAATDALWREWLVQTKTAQGLESCASLQDFQ